MTQDEIIRMAREAGSIDSEDVIETVWAAFAAAEQAEQEPVAEVVSEHTHGEYESIKKLVDYRLPCKTKLYASPVQQVTRADLKAAFKEGFERAADLYAPNDGQEPYAYEVWDVQDQSFTMIYATQLKEFHWIEPENIARVLYTAPVRTKDLTASEIRDIWNSSDTYDVFCVEFARAVIAADREKNK